MKKTIKDSELLDAMIAHLDENAVVYGAQGHYSVGAYYDIIGENYNDEENLAAASATTAAQIFRTNDGTIDDGFQSAIWLINI